MIELYLIIGLAFSLYRLLQIRDVLYGGGGSTRDQKLHQELQKLIDEGVRGGLHFRVIAFMLAVAVALHLMITVLIWPLGPCKLIYREYKASKEK